MQHEGCSQNVRKTAVTKHSLRWNSKFCFGHSAWMRPFHNVNRVRDSSNCTAKTCNLSPYKRFKALYSILHILRTARAVIMFPLFVIMTTEIKTVP